MTLTLAGVMLYVAVQLAIGIAVSRRVHSEEDYLLAGRNLGPFLGFFTIFATWFGAETCIGAAGSIYADGLSGGTADPFGYALCLLFMGAVFAVPLRRRRLTTIGDLFRQRYSPGVERLFAVLVIPTSVFWAAAQIRAFGQVLAASSQLPIDTTIAIAAAVAVTYTVFGGLLADAVTDFVQGVALLIGLLMIAVLLHLHTGGLGAALSAVEPARFAIGGGSGGLLLRVEAWAIPICGSVLAQELVARVLAVRSPQVARRAAVSASGLYLAVGMIPVTIGLLGPGLLPDLDHPEQILPRLAAQLMSNGWYVIFAGALVSAILSTVDSALLAAASLFSHNLWLSLRPATSEAAKVRVARAGVVVFGITAYLMAVRADGVYALVEEASAFGSAGVFVTGVVALFGRSGGPAAAVAALLGGLVSYVYGAHWAEWQTPYLASLLTAAAAYAGVAIVGHYRGGSTTASGR